MSKPHTKQRSLTDRSKFLMVLAVMLGCAIFYFGYTAMGGTSIATTLNLLGIGATLDDGLVAHWTFDGEDMVNYVLTEGSYDLVSDTFTEGSDTVADTRTPDVFGGDYYDGETTGTCGLYVDATNDNISSAESISSGGCGSNEGQVVYSSTTMPTRNYEVSGTIEAYATDQNSDRWSLICRYEDSSNFSGFAVSVQSTITTFYQLFQGSAGSSGSPFNTSLGDTITVRCQGDTISLYREASLISSYTDTGTNPGYPGFGLGKNSGAALNTWTVESTDFDNFTVRTLGDDTYDYEFIDRSGNGNAVTAAGIVTTGPIGQALAFNGIDDVATTTALGSGLRTISFWLKSASSSAQEVINIDGTDHIELNGSGQILATSFPGTTNVYIDGESGSQTTQGQWHHVVVTTSSGVNGSSFELGRVGSGYFQGSLDDVRIFDRVITGDEITQLYRQGATTKIAKTPEPVGVSTTIDDGLVEHWAFDGGDISSTFSGGGPDTTGDTNAGAGSNRTGVGSSAWTNGGNIFTSNDSDASVAMGFFGSSNYLEANNFGLAVPSGATITGIEFDVERSASGASVQENNVYLVLANDSLGATDKDPGGTWPTSDAYVTYGGPGDTWGETLTGADVNDSDFGIAISLSNGAFGSRTGYVDHVRINVYYTEAQDVTLQVQSRTVGGAQLTAGNGEEAVAGPIGQSLAFDGVDDVATTTALGSGLRTISFWLKADDNTSRKVINIDGTDQIELNGSGQIVATSFPGTTNVYIDGESSNQTEEGEWHHVVVTTTTGVNGSTFELGRVSASYFDGALDDIRIFDRVITTGEIQQLYRMGATTKISATRVPPALDSGLVYHWSFDGSTMSINDSFVEGTIENTGWTSPGTTTNYAGSGDNPWIDSGNATASDNASTSVSTTGSIVPFRLVASDFGWTTGDIPSGATIQGIEARVEAREITQAFYSCYVLEVQYVDETGVYGGTNQSGSESLTGTDTYYTFGGSSNLWGGDWTDSDIRDTDFGFVFRPYYDDAVCVAYVDHMQMRIYYSEDSGEAALAFTDDVGAQAVVTSGEVESTYGPIGQSLAFDGVDDVATTTALGGGLRTISFWMKADDNTSRKVINIDGTDQIELNGSGQIVATSFPGTTNVYIDGESSNQTEEGEWHHVVVTTTTGVNGSTFELGRVSASYFDGALDDIRIFDRVITTGEIQQLYRMGR